ncbi:DMT family transporter [Pseudomonas oryzihabitans]|uniref:DMT family transporter n=1 Tax=Pseudomonas oryzihabitans TaxID=47885 RepID=UPI003B228406
MNSDDKRIGISLCLTSMAAYAIQDGITKVLVSGIPATQIVMIRCWVLLLVALVFAVSRRGIRQSARSSQPAKQTLRALLGVAETYLFIVALRHLGLAETHAIYAVFPILTIGLAGLFLGERISPRQWLAVAIGFVGTLTIIRPGFGVFSLHSLIPLLAAALFANYNILTRRMSRQDDLATNLLYLGFWGALLTTLVGLPDWQTPTLQQTALILALSLCGVTAQLLLLQALKYTAAATLQPFNYSLLLFASLIGVCLFGERLDLSLVIGAMLVVVGGLLSFGRLKG